MARRDENNENNKTYNRSKFIIIVGCLLFAVNMIYILVTTQNPKWVGILGLACAVLIMLNVCCREETKNHQAPLPSKASSSTEFTSTTDNQNIPKAPGNNNNYMYITQYQQGNRKTAYYFQKNKNFSNHNLVRKNFSYKDLQGANFTGSNLQGVNFKDADLTEVNFTGAILKKVIGIGSNYNTTTLTSYTITTTQPSSTTNISFNNCIISNLKIT